MKAKYVKTILVKDRFNPYKIKIYEYRGEQYTLEFDLTGRYLGYEISVRGGHLNEQAEIDAKLDKKDKKDKKIETEPAEIVFERFYRYCNGDENAFDDN